MGTRSLTHVKNDEGKTLVTIYRQFDGYPSGMGEDLKKFLENMKLVNGFQMGMKAGEYANGMGCLAAQLVANLKDDIGEVYIYEADSSDCWEEFTYTIYPKDGVIYLKLDDGEVFDGPIAEFSGAKVEKELYEEA